MNTHLAPPTREFNPAEFALVVALAFGLPLLGSLSAVMSYTGGEIAFGDADVLATVAFELVVGAIVWFVLRNRGWKWSDFAIYASRGSTILGAILAAIVLVVWLLLEAIIGKAATVSTAGPAAIVIGSLVNPVFEEMLVLGYVVQALRKRFGLTTAFNVSLALRVLYHLYEGPLAVIPLAFFGLVMTLVYVRMGRLWPCIVAHGILDFVGLADLA
jgi:CAAX protease family protein